MTPRTVSNWINRGRAGEEPFAAFFLACKRAEADAKHDILGRAKAGEKGWQGAMTVAERRWWKQFGRKSQVVDSGGNDVITSLASLMAKAEADQAGKG